MFILVIILIVISYKLDFLYLPNSEYWSIGKKRDYASRYVLGWDFHEGQTCASRNLLSLVHWASDINSRVVEPCVHDSFFNFGHCTSTLNLSLNNNLPLLFRDYFDVDYWNQKILLHKIGQPLIPWEEFISNISREAIVVYLWPQEGTHLSVFVDEEIQRNAPDCYKQNLCAPRPQFDKNVLNNLGIKVVREVCFKFDYYVPIKVQWFNKQLLGNYTRSHIMIWFSHWMGTFEGRLFMANTDRLEMKVPLNYLKPSHRVVEHSKKYREQFLGEDGYVAVALRTAKVAMVLKDRKHKSQADIIHYITENCTHQVSSALEKVKGKRLLALDLGRFGDGEASVYITNDTMYKTIPKLVNIVYGNKWNWTQWEESFVQATGGITDAGYIAMMQKILVTNAACIIKAGIGEFQNSLMEHYKEIAKDPCIHQVCAV